MNRWTSQIARACAMHPWRTLGGWGLALVAALASVAVLMSSALTTEARFTAERDSLVGWELLDERMPDLVRAGSEVVVVRADDLTVQDAAFERFGTELAADLSATGEAAEVPTFWTTGDASLASPDGRATLLPVTLVDDEPLETAVEPLLEAVERADADPACEVAITGTATLGNDFVRISEPSRSEGSSRSACPQRWSYCCLSSAR